MRSAREKGRGGIGRLLWRWGRRLLMVVVAIAAATLALVLVAAKTDKGREWLRATAISIAADYVHGALSLAQIEGDLFDDFSLADIDIRDKQNQKILAAKRIRASYRPLGLISQKVHVEKLHIDGAFVDLATSDVGSPIIGDLFAVPAGPEDDQPSTWEIVVDDLWLRDAAVDLSELVPELGIIDSVTIRGSVRIEGGRVSAELSTFKASVQNYGQSFDGRLTATVDGGRVEGGFDLQGTGLRVTVPSVLFQSEPAVLVAAALLEIEPGLMRRYRPDIGVEDPAHVSLMVSSAGLATYSVSAGIGVADAEIALSGTADARTQTFSAAVSVSPLELETVVVNGPDLGTRGLRFAGRIDRTGKVEGHLAGLVHGMGVAEQSVEAFVSGDRHEIVGRLRAQGGGAVVEANGGIRIGEKTELLKTALDVQIPRAERVFPRRFGARGSMTAAFVAEGDLDSLDIRGGLRLRDGTLAGYSSDEVNISVRARDIPGNPHGVARIDGRGVVVGDLAPIRSKIEVSLSKRHAIEATIGIDGRDLQTDAAVKGRIEEDGIALSIQRLSGRVLGIAYAKGAGRVRFRDSGGVFVDNLSLRIGKGQADFDASVVPWKLGSQIQFRGRVENFAFEPLAEVVGVPGLSGRGGLIANVEFGAKRNRGDIALRFSASGDGLPAGDAAVELRLSGRKAQISMAAELEERMLRLASSATVRTPANLVSVPAWRAMGRGIVDEIDATATIRYSERLSHFLPQLPLRAGTVELHARASNGGRQGELRIDAARMRTPWVDADSELHLNLGFDGRELNLAAAAQVQKLGAVAIDGDFLAPRDPFSYRQWWQNRLETFQRIDIRLRNAWPTPALWRQLGVSQPMTGRADVAVDYLGPKNELMVRAEVHEFRTEPLQAASAISVVAESRGSQTAVRGVASLGDVQIARAAGDIAVGIGDVGSRGWSEFRNARVNASLRSPAFDTAKVAQMAGMGSVIAGQLELHGSLGGTIENPTGSGRVEITDVRYEDVSLETAALDLSVSEQKFSLQFDARQQGGGKIELEADSERGTDDPQRLIRLLASDFEIGLLAGLGPPSIRGVGGRLRSDITLLGRGDDVQSATGTLALHNGKVSIDGPVRHLSDVDLTVRATPTHFDLAAKARAGRGRVDISSRIDLRGFVPTTAKGRIEIKKLPLATAAGTTEVSAEGELIGAFDRSEIAFDVEIVKGLVSLPEGGGRELHGIGPPTDVIFVADVDAAVLGDEVVASSPIPPITLSVDIPQTVDLRSKTMSSVLGATMDLTFHRGRVDGYGFVELRRGWIKILRHRYEVERAMASFELRSEREPRVDLDISLRHEFKTAEFRVLIEGELDEPPQPRFSSDPAVYDQAQLLSFFLGGSPDELERSQSNSGRAAGAAAALVTSQLTGIVEEILPVVDVLALETSEDSATPDQLLAGKWLTKKILLAYRARLSSKEGERSNVNEVTIEWWFLKRWLLQVYYGDRQAGAADILWIRRF